MGPAGLSMRRTPLAQVCSCTTELSERCDDHGAFLAHPVRMRAELGLDVQLVGTAVRRT